ncbi:MAG: MBOAT family O-acyltransferase [Thermoanaerobaculaceae bacterium]
MSLASLTFLLAFLPAFLAVYWPLMLADRGRRGAWLGAANAWLLLGSALAMLLSLRAGVVLLVAIAAVDFAAGVLLGGGPARALRGPLTPLDPAAPRVAWHRLVVLGATVIDLGVLAAWRYTGWPPRLLGLPGATSGGQPADVMALAGLSFVVFRSLAYTLEVYRGTVCPTRNPFRYLGFVAFFPQVEAGPITRFSALGPQLERREIRLDMVAEGVARLIQGLAKKLLVANPLSGLVDQLVSPPYGQLATWQAWLALAAFMLQIYFDFAGYSDMAIGLGRMLGFATPENFAHPYAARSLTDFWRRWHLTLTFWLRDFVFLPIAYALDRWVQRLGWVGRRSDRLTYAVAALLTMTLCGLWHGVGWGFVLWGALHGLVLGIERLGWGRVTARAWRPLQHAYLLLAVGLAWVLFRSPTLPVAGWWLAALAGQGGKGPPAPAAPLTPEVLLALALGILLSAPLGPWLRDRFGLPFEVRSPRLAATCAGLRSALLLALLVICILALAGGAHRSFIYARF